MSSVISCVDRSQLQRLLALPADSDERQALDKHLGQCDACRRLLLEFTSEAVRLTATAAPPFETPTASQSGTRTQDKPVAAFSGATTQTKVKEADCAGLPHEPERLGRLAHYELLEVIGRGGMGTVFRAHDETLHRIVAVKIMAPELAASEPSRQRFIREARAAAQVTHEHVVTIHAVDDTGRVPFLVMQHIEGMSLQQRLQEGPLPVQEVVRIGREIAEGLAAAHAKGLVHRDIKPGNVLLEAQSGKVKITDFGLARAVDDASISQSGAVIGTPLYMAPEQARGETLDQRADLFSLGAVLYALCTGQSPFRASTSLAAMKRVCDDDPEPIQPVNPRVPGWLEQVIRRLLEKDPVDRFQTALDVAKQLGTQLTRLRTGSKMENSRTELLPRVRGRSPTPYWVAAASILLTLGIVAAIWFATRAPSNGGDSMRLAKKHEEPVGPGIDAHMPEWDQLLKGGLVPDPNQLLKGGGLMPDPAQMMKLFEMHPFLRNPELIPNLFGAFGGGGVKTSPPGWMANSSDGKRIAVPVGGNVVLIGDNADKFPKIEETDSTLHCVAFSADNHWLIGGCESKSDNLIVWDLQNGRIAWRPEGHRGEINRIAGGMGGRFVTASNDGTAKVWSVGSKTASVTFSDHQDFVRCVAFFPGQLRIVSGGDDKIIRIWDATSGKALKELAGHTAPIRGLVFSPNGKVLVTGSDVEMKLWNAETFEEYATIPTPSGWLAFAPDGLTLFSAGCDHSRGTPHAVTLWNTRTWEMRTSYTLGSRGGQAIYHLSADGGILLANPASNRSGSTPVAVYQALTGKDLMTK